MQTFFKQRQKSLLVKHYHQEELKRLQKKLDQIKHRKKGIFPQNKENTLPLLPPRYNLTLNRKQQIKNQNDRLSSRIAETKVKESEYFRKILKEKEKIKNLQLEERNKLQSMKVKLIYSSSATGIFNISAVQGNKEKQQDKSDVRALTQRAKMHSKVNQVL